MRTHIWREIDFLDQVVQNLTLEWEGRQYDYQQMCALRIDGYCWDNEVLDLGVFIDQIEQKEINLTYPIWFNPTTYKGYGPFPMYFGGIAVSNLTAIIHWACLCLDCLFTNNGIEAKKQQPATYEIIDV